MMDIQLFGMESGWHHLSNLLFHIANTVLLFFILVRMTGNLWSSSFVAVVFAIHPLHVESVAWVSERKDVLSTFFWMLTLVSYHLYVQRRCLVRYLYVVLFYLLGLMAKSMLVTLPFSLLLLDIWPLGRLQLIRSEGRIRIKGNPGVLGLIGEKIPLFILSAASSVATYLVQKSGGAIETLQVLSIGDRFGNALVSYVLYIGKMLWPFYLSVFYPHPSILNRLQVYGAFLILLFISVLAVRNIRRQPWLFVGWFWFMGTLVPVIGLVQVGRQSMADRYTYVPLIGLLIVIAWGIPAFVKRWRITQTWFALVTGTVVVGLLIVARIQVNYWDNSIHLFEHALEVTDNNALAHNNLANALADEGRFDEALEHISAALRINPNDAGAYNNFGNILTEKGKFEAAVPYFYKAIQLNPDYADAHYNLAIALEAREKIDDALIQYRKALSLNPGNVNFHNNLANALLEKGWIVEAIRHYQAALSKDLNDPEVLNNYGVALIYAGNTQEAVKYFRKAFSLDPEYTIAKNNLLKALTKQKQIKEKKPEFGVTEDHNSKIKY